MDAGWGFSNREERSVLGSDGTSELHRVRRLFAGWFTACRLVAKCDSALGHEEAQTRWRKDVRAHLFCRRAAILSRRQMARFRELGRNCARLGSRDGAADARA